MNCKETFSDIVAVWPLPKGTIPYAIPFNVRRREYTLADMGYSSLSAFESVLASVDYYAVSERSGGAEWVEIEEMQSTVRSTTKQTVAGRYHEIALSLIINEKTDKAIEMAEQLESETHDFVIQISDGSLLLLRTVDDVYQCKTSEEYASDYALKHSIRIENVNGIIRLTT